MLIVAHWQARAATAGTVASPVIRHGHGRAAAGPGHRRTQAAAGRAPVGPCPYSGRRTRVQHLIGAGWPRRQFKL
jgi:hypothetical protein